MKKLLKNRNLWVFVAVVVLTAAFATAALAAPLAAGLESVVAVSFNIDINSIMAYASSMFDALMPIAAVGIGLSLGVGVIALLIRVVKGSLSGIG
jgi:hypothetical protein